MDTALPKLKTNFLKQRFKYIINADSFHQFKRSTALKVLSLDKMMKGKIDVSSEGPSLGSSEVSFLYTLNFRENFRFYVLECSQKR